MFLNNIITAIIGLIAVFVGLYFLLVNQNNDTSVLNDDSVSVIEDADIDTTGTNTGISTEEYEVTLKSIWSEDTHPSWVPEGAHLSPFVAYTYSSSVNPIYQIGSVASEGVEVMAETGGTKPIFEEIDLLKRRGVIYSSAKGNVFTSPGESRQSLSVKSDNPYISVVSMIAPSPDWFLIADAVLYKDGKWVERIEIEATLLDSGTDSGEEFNADDIDTIPKTRILPKDHPRPSIATFIFERKR